MDPGEVCSSCMYVYTLMPLLEAHCNCAELGGLPVHHRLVQVLMPYQLFESFSPSPLFLFLPPYRCLKCDLLQYSLSNLGSKFDVICILVVTLVSSSTITCGTLRRWVLAIMWGWGGVTVGDCTYVVWPVKHSRPCTCMYCSIVC